jgi:hypothetical protein
MGRSTLADQLPDVLLEAGVVRIYGVVGDSLNPNKIVLDGGVGEMIEMARANVRDIPHPATLR